MIIVDQWNDIIINFDNTGVIEISCEETTYDIDVWTDEMWRNIGKYKTEERAKKVLQGIIYAYTTNVKCYYMPAEEEK